MSFRLENSQPSSRSLIGYKQLWLKLVTAKSTPCFWCAFLNTLMSSIFLISYFSHIERIWRVSVCAWLLFCWGGEGRVVTGWIHKGKCCRERLKYWLPLHLLTIIVTLFLWWVLVWVTLCKYDSKRSLFQCLHLDSWRML